MLENILKAKKRRVEDLKASLPYDVLSKQASDRASLPLDLFGPLKTPDLSIIAEIKRASPSKGIINLNIDPVERALSYQACGASALSVLTEEDYFLGSFEDLAKVKAAVSLPVLDKDFIMDEYQILYAYARGADAVLLIAALLEDAELKRLYQFARSLGLSVLLEVHNEAELIRAARTEGRIIGINNRNLKTMEVDLKTFDRLCTLIPRECAIVCESGIKSFLDGERAYQKGADALLIGEALMRQQNVEPFLRGLKAYA